MVHKWGRKWCVKNGIYIYLLAAKISYARSCKNPVAYQKRTIRKLQVGVYSNNKRGRYTGGLEWYKWGSVYDQVL